MPDRMKQMLCYFGGVDRYSTCPAWKRARPRCSLGWVSANLKTSPSMPLFGIRFPSFTFLSVHCTCRDSRCVEWRSVSSSCPQPSTTLTASCAKAAWHPSLVLVPSSTLLTVRGCVESLRLKAKARFLERRQERRKTLIPLTYIPIDISPNKLPLASETLFRRPLQFVRNSTLTITYCEVFFERCPNHRREVFVYYVQRQQPFLQLLDSVSGRMC